MRSDGVGGCGLRFRNPGQVEGVPLFGVGWFGCCILLEKRVFFFRSESWVGMLGILSAVFYIEISG